MRLCMLALLFSAVLQAHAQFGRGNQDQRCFTPGANSAANFRVKASVQADADIRTDPLVLPDGTIVVGSIDHYIYFINPDATLKAKFKTNAGNSSSAALGKDGSVIIGSGDGALYFLNQDGTKKPPSQFLK